MYAIIETGGKQYKVTSGQLIEVGHLGVAEGEGVELNKVLLIANDDRVIAGTPTVNGAKVVATSRGEVRSKKIIVFKYKPKKRYRRKIGHRQLYTRLMIDKIVEPEAKPGEPAKKVRRRKSEVTKDGA